MSRPTGSYNGEVAPPVVDLLCQCSCQRRRFLCPERYGEERWGGYDRLLLIDQTLIARTVSKFLVPAGTIYVGVERAGDGSWFLQGPDSWFVLH
jgi:hypothetical protein